MAEEMTTDQKVRELAKASTFFKAGMAELIEGGLDPDELNQLLDDAEEGIHTERKSRKQAARRKKIIKRF